MEGNDFSVDVGTDVRSGLGIRRPWELDMAVGDRVLLRDPEVPDSGTSVVRSESSTCCWLSWSPSSTVAAGAVVRAGVGSSVLALDCDQVTRAIGWGSLEGRFALPRPFPAIGYTFAHNVCEGGWESGCIHAQLFV